MTANLTLISHYLCPYVQRAVISLSEKQVPHERIYVDLANKPEWFIAISPLGKTPVLKVGEMAIFESAAILEYLEETQDKPLHPADPLSRAEHRAWIEVGSAILNDIAGFYNASDAETFAAKAEAMKAKFARIEERLVGEPWFDGKTFHLVDAVFGPVFRYFEIFDRVGEFGVLSGMPKLADWRAALTNRPSIRSAVPDDYKERLQKFLLGRDSYLTELMVSR